MNETLPRRSCDIVMKGGITSGVVYPKAIAKLATRFIFKNIGGTSAGAIAAAVAAAAEYRRALTGSDLGFESIGKLSRFLAGKPENDTNTRLFSLFRPNDSTRSIFEVVTGFLGQKFILAKFIVSLRLAVKHHFVAGFLGALPGAALAMASFYWSDAGVLKCLWVAIGVLMAAVGGLIAIAGSIAYRFVTRVPANGFGLCNGMPDPGSTEKLTVEPLTSWLTTYLNEVAGLDKDDRPLIFGDLWNPHSNENQGDTREVNLEMMTTNLTHGRPYRLPFHYKDEVRENSLFYFRKDEFDRLFPESVVSWMINNPRPIEEKNPKLIAKRESERQARKNAGFYPLPAPENLPVVVATRMSLSFPVLLSAIPLHSIDYTLKNAAGETKAELERCWFTDGGLCSNFPLHFFDAPLPRRPTFSIDLTAKPNDTPDVDLNPEMDRTNGKSLMDRWNRFDLKISADPAKAPREKGDLGKLFGFAGTLISTMQNWNDATTGLLPGYRDRIVRIPLKSTHGGLNLDMPTDVVSFLSEQGGKSAEELMKHFDVPSVDPLMNWENHRWIRIRSMLAAFEKMVDEMLTTCDDPENNDVSYEDWLKALHSGFPANPKAPSYPPTKRQIEAAMKTIDKMRELRVIWSKAGIKGIGNEAPKPRPTLRPRSQI